MPNKVSTALYSGYPELLEHANDMLSNYKTYGTIFKVVTPNEGSPAPLSPTPGSLTYRPRLMDADRRKDQIDSEKEERGNRLKYASGPDHDRSKRTQTYSNLAKNRQAVANGFNQKDYKFSGSPGTGLALHLVKRKFNELIFEQEIPQSQTVQLIHNCLSGIANDYFYSNVRDVAKTPDEALKALENRFNSKQHHSQALAYLRRLSFEGIKNEKSCSNLEALSIAHSRIIEYIPQCGPSYQSEHQDGHMSEFPASMVDGQDWAENVLTARITATDTLNGMDCNSFYAMLISALTLLENRKNPSSTSGTESPSRFYGERYGNTPAYKKKLHGNPRARYRRSPAQLIAVKNRTRCLRCNALGHWKNECPQRGPTMTSIIRSRIKDRGGNDKGVAEVLYALVEGDDNFEEYMEAVGTVEETEDNSANAFESLFNETNPDEDIIDVGLKTILTAGQRLRS